MDEQELSGRELDAAVAEHVFGWKWLTIQGYAILFPDHWYQEYKSPVLSTSGRAEGSVMDISSSHFADSRCAPDGKTMPIVAPFSTHDTHALNAADTMQLFDQGYHLYRCEHHLYRGWYWYVRLHGDEEFIGHGETRAEALCRAAVRLAIADK